MHSFWLIDKNEGVSGFMFSIMSEIGEPFSNVIATKTKNLNLSLEEINPLDSIHESVS